MKDRQSIKKLLKVCKIKTKRNNILENLDLRSDIGIGINLSFDEDELLFDIILDIVGFPEDNTFEFERIGTTFPEGKRTDYENMFSRDYLFDPVFDFLNDYNEECRFEENLYFNSEDDLIDWLYTEKIKL